MYALPKTSFAGVSEWARHSGLGKLTPSAVFFRFRDSEGFFQACFKEALRHVEKTQVPQRFLGYRLLAADATVLCGPAAKGTDQRLHVVYDLGSGAPTFVEVTDNKGGESLARYESAFGPGDLVLGDRGYGHDRGIRSVLNAKSKFLIRLEFSSIRLLDEEGMPISAQRAKERMPARGCADFQVWLPQMETPLRVIGGWNDEGKPVWLITNLTAEELSADEARSLYSLRWQIELFFKRLKSLLDLDELPTRDGPTARPWIWAKLLLAALAVLMADEVFSPYVPPNEEVCMGEVSKGDVENHLRHPRSRIQAQETNQNTQEDPQTSQAICPLEA